MSLVVTTDVFCDGVDGHGTCLSWVHGVTGATIRARAARNVAKAEGWTRRSGRDLCAVCSGKLDSEVVR